MANNDEPLNVIYITSSYPQETYVYDGLKASKINVLMDGEVREVKVNVGDYVIVKNYQHDDPVVHEWYNDPEFDGSVSYVYTSNGKWMYAGGGHGYNDNRTIRIWYGRNFYNGSGSNAHYLDGRDIYKSEDEIIGNRSNTVISVDRWSGDDIININDYEPNYTEYGVDTYYYTPERTVPAPITTQAQIGDYAEFTYYYDDGYGEETYDIVPVIYQYPGVWVKSNNYPNLNISPILPVKPHVQIKWTDPQDITDWKPTPATWEGTVIVRKENTPPLHRWDGTKVVRSTTRDEYKTNAYKDEDVKTGKVYYYGFFPYYTKFPDPDHPIRFYTFTKYIRVETGVVSYAPVINSITVNGTSATLTYTIISPTSMGYATARLYGKIGSNPACDETDDIMLVVDQTKEEIEVTDLLYDTQYNFCIQVTDNTGEVITSNVVSTTAEDPVPPEYRQYINLINGCNGEGLDFFWKDYSVTGASRLTAIDNPANFSYVRPTGNWSGDQVIVISANTSNSLVASSIITLNINKQQNNTYKVLVSGYDIAINENRYAYSFQYSYYTARDGSLVASSDYVNQYTLDNYWKMGIFDYDFSTLIEALQFLTKNIRNCNIYVDGVLWSKANNTN